MAKSEAPQYMGVSSQMYTVYDTIAHVEVQKSLSVFHNTNFAEYG